MCVGGGGERAPPLHSPQVNGGRTPIVSAVGQTVPNMALTPALCSTLLFIFFGGVSCMVLLTRLPKCQALRVNLCVSLLMFGFSFNELFLFSSIHTHTHTHTHTQISRKCSSQRMAWDVKRLTMVGPHLRRGHGHRQRPSAAISCRRSTRGVRPSDQSGFTACVVYTGSHSPPNLLPLANQ